MLAVEDLTISPSLSVFSPMRSALLGCGAPAISRPRIQRSRPIGERFGGAYLKMTLAKGTSWLTFLRTLCRRENVTGFARIRCRLTSLSLSSA